jgi:DNA-directed RNA polymerase specialized sigma24 family protein
VHNAFTDALAELADAHNDVTGWLLQLAARACTRHSWATRRYRRAAHEVHENPGPPPMLIPAGMSARLVLVLGLARLTSNQRQALQLRYLDGYPRELIARLMDRSNGAVGHLEREGLRHLRTALTAADPTTRIPLTTKDTP